MFFPLCYLCHPFCRERGFLWCVHLTVIGLLYLFILQYTAALLLLFPPGALCTLLVFWLEVGRRHFNISAPFFLPPFFSFSSERLISEGGVAVRISLHQSRYCRESTAPLLRTCPGDPILRVLDRLSPSPPRQGAGGCMVGTLCRSHWSMRITLGRSLARLRPRASRLAPLVVGNISPHLTSVTHT